MKNSQPIIRDNHYVPRLYLKNFTNSSGKLHCYRTLVSHRNVNEWKVNSPAMVASQMNLYTQTTTEGDSDEMELLLHRNFEEPGKRAIQKAIAGSQLTPEDWQSLARFTLALDVRTPVRFLENMDRWQKTFKDQMLDSASRAIDEYATLSTEQRHQVSFTSEQANNYPVTIDIEIPTNGSPPRLKIGATLGRQLWLLSLRGLLTGSAMETVVNHRWTILAPANGFTWFTSDNPVVRLNYYRGNQYDFQGGVGNPGSEILLPLSPRHLLYTKVGERKPNPRGTIMSVESTRTVRRILAQHAHHHIYSSCQDQELPRLRPRIVNRESFQADKEFWDSYHSTNQQAEEELLTARIAKDNQKEEDSPDNTGSTR